MSDCFPSRNLPNSTCIMAPLSGAASGLLMLIGTVAPNRFACATPIEGW